jgi:uncharacterized protein (TIGR04255 family)
VQVRRESESGKQYDARAKSVPEPTLTKKKRAAKSRRGNGQDRLPSAPLSEVVFELRWQLQPGPFMPFDPLIMPHLAKFSVAMDDAGFSSIQDITHPQQTGPHGVSRRFRKSPDAPYPLMQIGPGIFAANESLQYTWMTYREQVLEGVKALFASYPTSLGFPLLPIYLELRYVDVFDKAILGHTSLFEFIETGTALGFKLPKLFTDPNHFWGDPSGRFSVQSALRGRKDSNFVVDIVPGQTTDANKRDIIQLTSRVMSTGIGVPVATNSRAFFTALSGWLEFAHDITSPFFKQFILPNIMKKFVV